MDKPSVLRLVNGEMIICRSYQVINNIYYIKKPYIPQADPRTGQIALLPYGFPFSEVDEISIKSEHIICALFVNEETEKAFIQTSSGIAIPEPGMKL